MSWSALSAESRETAALIGYRLSAGLTVDEVADELERERDQIKRNPLPLHGRPVTKSWVTARLRELRREILRTSSES